MARIVNVSWSGGSVGYYPFADGNIRNFLDFIPSGNVQDNRRFSIPGVNGNFLIRAGFRGLALTLKVRYKGLLADCNAAWKSDRENFARYSTAIDDDQTFYSRCTLRPDSGQRTTGEQASGNSGLAFFDVRYVFDIEEL